LHLRHLAHRLPRRLSINWRVVPPAGTITVSSHCRRVSHLISAFCYSAVRRTDVLFIPDPVVDALARSGFGTARRSKVTTHRTIRTRRVPSGRHGAFRGRVSWGQTAHGRQAGRWWRCRGSGPSSTMGSLTGFDDRIGRQERGSPLSRPQRRVTDN